MSRTFQQRCRLVDPSREAAHLRKILIGSRKARSSSSVTRPFFFLTLQTPLCALRRRSCWEDRTAVIAESCERNAAARQTVFRTLRRCARTTTWVFCDGTDDLSRIPAAALVNAWSTLECSTVHVLFRRNPTKPCQLRPTKVLLSKAYLVRF